MAVKPIPERYHTLNPMLLTERTAELFDFLVRVFDAEAIFRFDNPDGSPMVVDARIGDSIVSVMRPDPGTPTTRSVMYVYLPDVDDNYRRAIAAGAKSLEEPKDAFHGDRMAGFVDDFGNQWWIATHIEDVPTEELQRRMARYMAERSAGAPEASIH